MIVELSRTFHFSAAHRLPAAGARHKCARVHGHNFAIEIGIRGAVDPRTGWLIDFGELKKVVEPLIETLDHKVLNEIPGLENPTSENLARWIWDHLKPDLAILAWVTVSETPSTCCTYRGEE